MKAPYVPIFLLQFFLFSVVLTGCPGGGEPVGGKPQVLSKPDVRVDNADASELAVGSQLFSKNCRVCHGNEGSGWGSRKGPSLKRSEFTYGRNREAVMESIIKGRPKGMPAYGTFFNQEQLNALTSYVLSLK